MATTYDAIYNLAANKLTDPELALLPEDELEELFHGYLMSAISQFRKCKNDLSDRDDELRQFNADLLDVEKRFLLYWWLDSGCSLSYILLCLQNKFLVTKNRSIIVRLSIFQSFVLLMKH